MLPRLGRLVMVSRGDFVIGGRLLGAEQRVMPLLVALGAHVLDPAGGAFVVH